MQKYTNFHFCKSELCIIFHFLKSEFPVDKKSISPSDGDMLFSSKIIHLAISFVNNIFQLVFFNEVFFFFVIQFYIQQNKGHKKCR